MTDKERMSAAAEKLKKLYPDAACSLEYENEPWRLLVMGKLSAQCTDARVNIVCRDLFRKYPTAKALAEGDIREIEEIVRPCGLYRVKSADIKAECERLINVHGGVLPDTMEELLAFPGVGRKIANLLLGDIFKKGGVVTDTHCIRICGRLGFYPTELKDPLKVEKILTPLIESSEQSDLCHRLVLFGRDICTARSPKCDECPLSEICLTKGENKKRPQ